jgi:cell division protein FtsB
VKDEVELIKKNAGVEPELAQQQSDRLATENEILKSKIADLETRVNTLSRDESRVEEKLRYEHLLTQMSEDNRLLSDKLSAA